MSKYEGRTNINYMHCQWEHIGFCEESILKEKEDFDIIRIGLCNGKTGIGQCLYALDFYLDKKYTKNFTETPRRYINCGKLLEEKVNKLIDESVDRKILTKKQSNAMRTFKAKHCIIHNIRITNENSCDSWVRVTLINEEKYI